MYRQFGNSDYRNGFAGPAQDSFTVAQSGQLDALVALESIGARLSFARNNEIYAEGDNAECWYKWSPGPYGSASFSRMAGATLENSASAAIVSGSTAAANACTRPKRWTMSS